MRAKPPPFEVVGWFASFYEADCWVRKNKRYLIQRRYRLVKESDPEWKEAMEKGQIKVI